MKRTPALLTLAAAFAVGCNTQARSTNIVAAGHVEATDVHIAAKVGGKLMEAPLREGDIVKSGGLLARLDTTDAELLIRQASG